MGVAVDIAAVTGAGNHGGLPLRVMIPICCLEKAENVG